MLPQNIIDSLQLATAKRTINKALQKEADVALLDKAKKLIQGRTGEDALMDFISTYEDVTGAGELADIPEDEREAIIQDIREAIASPEKKRKQGFESSYYIPAYVTASRSRFGNKARIEDVVANVGRGKFRKRLRFLRDTALDAAANIVATDADEDVMKATAYTLAMQPKLLRFKWNSDIENFVFSKINDYMKDLGLNSRRAAKYTLELHRLFNEIRKKPRAAFKNVQVDLGQEE